MLKVETKEIDGYMHADTPMSAEQWLAVLQNPDTPKNYVDTLLKFYYEPDHEASCKKVGEDYGISSNAVNATVRNFGEYVQKQFEFSIVDENDDKRFWLTIMDGKQEGKWFSYRIKKELNAAILDYLYSNLVSEYIRYRKEMIEKGSVNGQSYNELYKWELLKNCQDKSLLEQADLWKETNLYYNIGNRKVVKDLITNHPSEYEAVLSDLCDEGNSLTNRLADFRNNVAKLVDAKLTSKANDERTAATILACHNPQKYTFYMSDFYEKFCEYLGVLPEKRVNYKYPHFLQLLQPLKNLVAKNEELAEIVTPTLSSLPHSDLLLAQDICWCFFHMSIGYLNLPPKKNEKESTNNGNKMESEYQKYIDLLLANHNLILTGAPGTGKTYLAKQMAAEMIGCKVEELAASGHFGFVQFHPSYDYTDFVEGLRPVQSDDDNDQIGFERKNGVFKEFCEQALSTPETISFDDTYDKFIDNISNKDNSLNLKTPLGASFSVSVNNKGNLSLHTGKDFKKNGVLTREKLKSGAVYGNSPFKWWKGYYEGVIKELVKNYGLVIKDNHTLFPEKESLSKSKPYIFVIDEINRGEISKIFGELFSLLTQVTGGKQGR